MSRIDTRQPTEVRSISITYEKLDRADGSASFAFGGTKALASVSGPIEVRLAAEQPSKATFEVIVRPLSGIPGTESKALSASLRSLLAPSLQLSCNPRTLVQLVIQSLTPSRSNLFPPSLLATFINVATLALLNAGSVPMSGVVCAVAVARIKSFPNPADYTLFLDPSDEEASSSEGGGCFAFLFTAGPAAPEDLDPQFGARLVWSNWQAANGAFDVEELSRAKKLAKAGAEQVWQKMKESVGEMGGLSQALPISHKVEDNDAMQTTSDDDAKMEI